MTKHYEQRKEANKKYLEKYEDIKIRVPLGTRDKYKAHAERKNTSLNKLIIELLNKDMETE